jgi:uncharacterized protein DUF6093
MISPGLLDYLRSLQELLFPDTCAILRYTETNTPDGPTADWQPIATGLPCRVDQHRMTAAERLGGTGAVLQSVSDWIIHLPAHTDVTPLDRVTITGSDRPDGRTFEVTSVGEQSYETARECACVLLE